MKECLSKDRYCCKMHTSEMKTSAYLFLPYLPPLLFTEKS